VASVAGEYGAATPGLKRGTWPEGVQRGGNRQLAVAVLARSGRGR
jgi:hypothetical protein